jgi:membrane-anchored protein YejM (alkaline phosphatase superfamily)
VYGVMAMETGLYPHSTKTVARAFPLLAFDSYAPILRRHGYDAYVFSAADPDWDGIRYWEMRWYDEVHYDPALKGQDRAVMRAAAKRLEARNHARPFVATFFLSATHLPFRTPEPRFERYTGTDLPRKILNPMRYTDDVLEEFFLELQHEPWFDRTVFIITSDHAMDLGERGEAPGPTNVRHETNWIPLILFGAHPRLPGGRQDEPASQVDVAPSILDLAGVCDDNSFVGHSVFASDSRFVFNTKNGHLGLEDRRYSLYAPDTGDPYLYEADDVLQRTNVASSHPDVTAAMVAHARSLEAVTDYLYDTGRVRGNSGTLLANQATR